MKLLHFSDIHFGLEDPRAIAWAAECVARERPDAVVITGDHTMRARNREFVAACRWISALPAPVTIEVGNHDLPYFNLIERFVRPYRRFKGIEALVERKLHLGDEAGPLVIVPLKTTARAQPRLNWSKGWISAASLRRTLAAIDALPPGARALVAAHHPLVETGTKGTAMTRHGKRALEELARRPAVLAVLSGHVHDPFDLTEQTANGPVRMIGAGTLSMRIRSTPPASTSWSSKAARSGSARAISRKSRRPTCRSTTFPRTRSPLASPVSRSRPSPMFRRSIPRCIEAKLVSRR